MTIKEKYDLNIKEIHKSPWIESVNNINKLDTKIYAFNDSNNNMVFFKKNELIIGIKTNEIDKTFNDLKNQGVEKIWFDNIGSFGLFSINSKNLEETLNILINNNNILFAEPNLLDRSMDFYDFYDDLESDSVAIPKELMWNHKVIDRKNGVADGNGIVIAVVDVPIYVDHPGFSESFCIHTNELHFGDNSAIPDKSHGTSVASILVDATKINEDFTLGLSPAAKVLPISIDASSGSSYARRATAINFLAKSYEDKELVTPQGQKISLPKLIVNCSWQVQGTQDLTSVSLAFSRLIKSGAICVCSAGNGKSSQIHYPSDYLGCLSIAALAKNLNKSESSNFGSSIDFSMPGGDGGQNDDTDNILAARAPNQFDYVSGTSFAAPHASAMLANIWSNNISLEGPEVVELAKNRFSKNIDEYNSEFQKQLGAGLICFTDMEK